MFVIDEYDRKVSLSILNKALISLNKVEAIDTICEFGVLACSLAEILGVSEIIGKGMSEKQAKILELIFKIAVDAESKDRLLSLLHQHKT